MRAIRVLVSKYPVLPHFSLTFAVSWGGVLILGARYGIPAASEQFNKRWPVVAIPYFLGLSMAGFLLNALIYGRADLRGLLSRTQRLSVPPNLC